MKINKQTVINGSVTINGTTYSGKLIVIENGKITIDGVVQEIDQNDIKNITINNM